MADERRARRQAVSGRAAASSSEPRSSRRRRRREALVGVDLLPLSYGEFTILEINGAVDFTSDYRPHGDVFREAALEISQLARSRVREGRPPSGEVLLCSSTARARPRPSAHQFHRKVPLMASVLVTLTGDGHRADHRDVGREGKSSVSNKPAEGTPSATPITTGSATRALPDGRVERRWRGPDRGAARDTPRGCPLRRAWCQPGAVLYTVRRRRPAERARPGPSRPAALTNDEPL